jgi:pimeloyl-ACP methyl ester carboxylesterase
LAYSEVGDPQATQVLLCLPGLLETRASFDSLLQAAQNLQGLRVVSLDLCGRGDSDALPNDTGYCMSQYLSDVTEFIRHVLIPAGQAVPRITLLGTSMGGILAMYLAQNPQLSIKAIFLNDVGLSLHWMSIYGLYSSMKKNGRVPDAHELAAQLRVSVGVVGAVQSPHHFDLPYKKDWKGMRFVQALHDFTGELRLVYGKESGVCLAAQVTELQAHFPKAKVLAVEGAKHPVPFDAKVVAFLLKGLGAVEPKPQVVVQPPPVIEVIPSSSVAPIAVQLEMPLPPAVAPVELPPVVEVVSNQVVSEQLQQAQKGWLTWFKQRLKPKAK